MKLGLFTPVFGKLSTRDMLARVKALGKVQALELGTGGWPGSDHLNLDALVTDRRRADEYRTILADAGLTISALSCHGNPLHPDPQTAQAYDEGLKAAVDLLSRAILTEPPVEAWWT
jgi:sugar phosphate isomerase/epimerase